MNGRDSAAIRSRRRDRRDEVDKPLSCRGITGETRPRYDFTFASGADVNAYYVGMRLLPLTNGRLPPPAAGTQMPELRAGVRPASTADGCVSETHATYRGLAAAIAREWSAGDYRGIITPALCTRDLCLICN